MFLNIFYMKIVHKKRREKHKVKIGVATFNVEIEVGCIEDTQLCTQQ